MKMDNLSVVEKTKKCFKCKNSFNEHDIVNKNCLECFKSSFVKQVLSGTLINLKGGMVGKRK